MFWLRNNNASKQFLIVTASIAMIIGFLMLVFATILIISINMTYPNFITTQGTVIGYEPRTEDNGTITYSEIATYIVDGKTYTATNINSSSVPKEIGATIKIAYSPDNPSNAYFPSSYNILYILCFSIGGILFIVPGVYVVNLVRQVRQERKNIEMYD